MSLFSKKKTGTLSYVLNINTSVEMFSKKIYGPASLAVSREC